MIIYLNVGSLYLFKTSSFIRLKLRQCYCLLFGIFNSLKLHYFHLNCYLILTFTHIYIREHNADVVIFITGINYKNCLNLNKFKRKHVHLQRTHKEQVNHSTNTKERKQKYQNHHQRSKILFAVVVYFALSALLKLQEYGTQAPLQLMREK